MQNAFFYNKVIYPFVSSYLSKTTAALYRTTSLKKQREYEKCIIQVENASFTHLVMSSTGGMCDEMSITIKHLARLQSEKRNETYSKTVGVLRCRFAFAIARSALVCLRESRSIRYRSFDRITLCSLEATSPLVIAEARLE